MTAKQLSYWQYDETDPLVCPSCGWTGTGVGAEMNVFRELVDLRCPNCEQMLVIVANPTIEETKRAAAAGNPRAIADMDYVRQIEAFRARWERERLHSAAELPELEGTELAFVWDFEQIDGTETARTIIRHGDREVWSEPALWEGGERFREVKTLLEERYGARFVGLAPSEASRLFLYGDGGA
jgi:hypothetical protein